jgi:hypothetical protein
MLARRLAYRGYLSAVFSWSMYDIGIGTINNWWYNVSVDVGCEKSIKPISLHPFSANIVFSVACDEMFSGVWECTKDF